MPGVVEGELLSGSRESLARERRGPDRPVVGPAAPSERGRPSADPGEEVSLAEASDVVRTDVLDVASIDLSGRQSSSCDETIDAIGGVVVILIVVHPLHASLLGGEG
jgi:hypothetical protein